jgi:hypothetical protein
MGLFSSSRFRTHEGSAYHRNGGRLRRFLKFNLLNREDGGEEILKKDPLQPRIHNQQGCPLNVQGL